MSTKFFSHTLVKMYLAFLLGVVLTAGVFLFTSSNTPAPAPAPQPTVTQTVTRTPSATPTSKPPTSTPPPASPTPTHTATPKPSWTTSAHKKPSATPTHDQTSTNRSTVRASLTSPRSYARSVMSSTQYSCFSSIVTRESGWNVYARNPYSGAYGLGQALPGSKMRPYGADWRTNGITQIKWMRAYIKARYGTPCGAWSFWQRHHWY